MSIPALSERNSVRVAVLLLALAEYAVMYDQWWHRVFGRDSIMIPPHLFVYGMSAVLILFSWYALRRFRTPLWRKLGILMTILPISAPFDSFWHATFGVENVTSILVAWSPPHVILAFMFITAQYFTLQLVRAYETDHEAKKLLSILILALFISSVSFLLLPLQPFVHFHILGLYGFIFTLPIMVSLLIFARREFGFAGATLLALFFLARAFAGSAETFEAYAPISPLLLSAAPLLFAAVFLDAMPRRADIFTQASVFGIALALSKAGVFFLFGLGLFSALRFSLQMDYLVLVLTTIIGCMLGGILYIVLEKQYVSLMQSRG